jgi:hypothetical protein
MKTAAIEPPDTDALHDFDTEGFGGLVDQRYACDPALWTTLLAEIDYQSKRWYLFDAEIGQWKDVAIFEIDDILFGHGIGIEVRFEPVYDAMGTKIRNRIIADPHREWIKKMFRERDRVATKREHDPEKRKRQVDKDRRNREREDRQLIRERKRQMQGRQSELWQE